MATYEETYSRIINELPVKELLKKSQLNDHETRDLVMNIITSVSHYKRNKKFVYKNIPKDFVVIDIETTGLKSDDEIIQLSAIKFINNKRVDVFDSYIKPLSSKISYAISNLTGITETMLADAPFLEDVQQSFISFVGDLAIVGHNITAFDLPKLNHFNIDLSDNLIFDTLRMSEAFLTINDHKLETIKEYYGIRNVAHNALNDCEAEAQIFLKFSYKDFVPVSETAPSNLFLAGKKVVLSGNFKVIPRKKLENLVLKYGGTTMKSITKNTDLFVDGIQTARNLIDGIHSSKELAAIDLQKETGKPAIIKETEFLELLQQSGEII
ncbi:exonuclease domain-containing protein [Leuconostoc citreum]|uniref:exonuclease domain-containing protein n=1 Tax=Leuconostoc citreum TaxID=33964 RepID=UPI0021A6E37E|nr:exonuclease domain-containing protein [Leuconostoc citreum]MCT3071631.1 hypothetical protein [Leuconostoc citreum]